MEPTPDEIAGTVDHFGGLTRRELVTALNDLAARTGEPLDRTALDDAIDAALNDYYLIEIESGVLDLDLDETLLVAGPTALPALPSGGEDLPHLLDVERRRIDRSVVAERVETMFRADAAAVIDRGDVDGAEQLLDTCYEVEAWGPVDLSDAKDGLSDLLE